MERDEPRRTTRRQAARTRRGWRRRVARVRDALLRLFANLSLGFLLVGCSTMPAPFGTRVADSNQVMESSRKPEERLAAIKSLANPSSNPVERERGAELLTAAVQKEKSQLLRATALQSLARYSAEEAATALGLGLEDSSVLVRRSACVTAGKLKCQSCLEALETLARGDESEDVRLAATEALVQLGRPEADETFLVCLRDDNLLVARTAADGLRKNNPEANFTDYKGWSQYLASTRGVQLPGRNQPADPAPTQISGLLDGPLYR